MNDYSAMRFLFRPWHAQDFFNILIFNILTRIFFSRITRGRSCEFFLLNEFLFNCQAWLLFACNCVFKLRYFARDKCNLRGLAYNYFAYKVNFTIGSRVLQPILLYIYEIIFQKDIVEQNSTRHDRWYRDNKDWIQNAKLVVIMIYSSVGSVHCTHFYFAKYDFY